jgi:hypothetical protein|tara:strand:- start:495 stop:779 length:285 start_codon:yes stop_codon:yes gene_type:complete
MIDQAIYTTHPNVVSILEGKDAYDAQGNPVVLDMSLVNAEVTQLQAEHDSKQYSRDRAKAYSLLNQFEMQFDDSINSTTTWVDAINEIKQRFPK